MITNKKVTGKSGSIVKGIAVGTVVAMLVTILFAVGMTQMILTEKVETETLGYGAMILLPLASAISAMIAFGIIKRRRMQVCLLAGLAYFVALGCVNVVFFGGQFGGVGVSVLMIFLGAFGVGALGLRGERRAGKKRKMTRHR